MTDKDETSNVELTSLYDTIKGIYSHKKPISRVTYITKLKEMVGKDEKSLRETVLGGFKKELMTLLKRNNDIYNTMIFYLGSQYALVSIESSSDNLMNFLTLLHKTIKSGSDQPIWHTTVNILNFVEDCPYPSFPAFYKYESSLSQQELQLYKGKPAIEKAWVLYDNLFCNLGNTIKSLVKTEEDFSKNEGKIKTEESPYLKYIPSNDEVNEFLGPDFISLDKFINFYVDPLEIELDENFAWPYYWPINV